MKVKARLVRPEESGPVNSLIAPTGKPPFSKPSRFSIPMGAGSQTVLNCELSAAGKVCSSDRSILIFSKQAE